jgi:hypothetical protein
MNHLNNKKNINKIRIQLLKPLGRHRVGTMLDIECDDHGIPLDFFWQKRIRASFYDKSLVIIAKNQKFKHNRYKVEILYKNVINCSGEGVHDNNFKAES